MKLNIYCGSNHRSLGRRLVEMPNKSELMGQLEVGPQKDGAFHLSGGPVPKLGHTPGAGAVVSRYKLVS